MRLPLLQEVLKEVPLDLSQVDDPFEQEFVDAIKKNKKKVIVYHGTSTYWFWPIINKGFKFSEDRRNWENTSEGVYFSFDIDRAGQYTVRAVDTVGGEPIIFVLEIPVDMIERDMDDAKTWDKDTNYQAVVKQAVKPNFITGVVFPAISTGPEIPIRKFIQSVNKGKVFSIEPEANKQKRRFSNATKEDMEHVISRYVQDLLQYTSFGEYNFAPKNYELNRLLIRDLQKPEMEYSTISQWTGDDWVEYLEKSLGVVNAEDYYKTQRIFQLPLWQVIKRYMEPEETFKKYRLGQK